MAVLFDKARTLLVVVDVQERLLPVIEGHHAMLGRIIQLHGGAKKMGVRVAVSEQYPQGLGATVAELSKEIDNNAIRIEKKTFSAWDALKNALKHEAQEYDQLVVCGIESHICVLQTAFDAMQDGKQVGYVVDAIGSRRALDKDMAMMRMNEAGLIPLTSEMILLEWLKTADDAAFKDISRLIK